MKRSRLIWTTLIGVCVTLASGLVTAVAAPTLVAAQGIPQVPQPTVKLIVAQNDLTLDQIFGQVDLDPGVWVASLGEPLQFDVQRESYTSPITLTQLIWLPGGSTRVIQLPGNVLDGFNGLRNFLNLRLTNTKGKVVVDTTPTFCPNADTPARVTPDSPTNWPYPPLCGNDPFATGLVMGIARDWAVDPFSNTLNQYYTVPLGTYTATVTIASVYQRLLHISPQDATAQVKITVISGPNFGEATTNSGANPGEASPSNGSNSGNASTSGVSGSPRSISFSTPAASARYPQNSQDATMPRDNSVLPDLISLPAWGITISHETSPDTDMLHFGATIWVSGNGPLDIEGFRDNGSPTMPAYQYFWSNGHIVGRVPAGTMGFDSQPGHNHWHFQQFAEYQLLNADKRLVVRSAKVGFCITPTDPVDLLEGGAVWQPPSTGLSGQCGVPTALWVTEYLPVGWGDTYPGTVTGNSFDITNLPNGTYFIEVVANPSGVIHEVTRANDISLREVILGGQPGHRTVQVPAWKGIDPEP